MKRSKKAKWGKEVSTYTLYYVECPHCKTKLRGGFDPNTVLMFLCYHCKNPIDLRGVK